MANVTISKKELKKIIKESVREELSREVMRLRALALPEVSDKEQKEIEKKFGKPFGKRARSVELEI